MRSLGLGQCWGHFVLFLGKTLDLCHPSLHPSLGTETDFQLLFHPAEGIMDSGELSRKQPAETT